MSHQTGITVSPELAKTFQEAQQAGSKCRYIAVKINNESLEVVSSVDAKGTWEQDFDLFKPLLKPDEPLYIIYRHKQLENSWILFTFVPDASKVRDKMLYAATKASLTKALGDTLFNDSVFASTLADMSIDGFNKYLKHKTAEAPLTSKEAELKEIKLAEIGVDIGTESRKSHVSGVSFAVSESGKKLISNFSSSSDAIVFSIGAQESFEATGKKSTADVALALSASWLPQDQPAFTLFKYTSGDKTVVVFLYTCPQAASIRLKMLYSSARGSLLQSIADAGVQVDKRLEVSELDEITTEWLEQKLGFCESQAKASHGFKKKLAPPSGRKLVSKGA